MHFSEKLLKYFWWTFISLIHLHLHEEIFVGINDFAVQESFELKLEREDKKEFLTETTNGYWVP